MFEVIETIGIVGAVATVVSLFLPAATKSQRIIHAIYVSFIVLISSTAVIYKSKLDRINNSEKSAKAIIDGRRMDYTNEGFNMAALAFLEKYKDLYPGSYERAVELCKNNTCLENANSEKIDSLNHAYSQLDVSSALSGMLKGISEISHE